MHNDEILMLIAQQPLCLFSLRRSEKILLSPNYNDISFIYFALFLQSKKSSHSYLALKDKGDPPAWRLLQDIEKPTYIWRK